MIYNMLSETLNSTIVKPHRMNETRPIAIDDHVMWCVCKSVYHVPVTCKIAEQIEVLIGVETLGSPRNIALDGGPDPPTARGGGGDSMRPPADHLLHYRHDIISVWYLEGPL